VLQILLSEAWFCGHHEVVFLSALAADLPADQRPNILFCIADDWGWPHASAYGEPVLLTPNFDRIAEEGALYEHAYVSSPSCTPSRNAILTGQFHWRLKEGGNLWSTLRPEYPVYPMLLQDAGYAVGHWRKSWGPGDYKRLGRIEHPAGPRFGGFPQFLEAKSDDQPFCFWLGASDPHRPYQLDSGEQSGMDLSKIRVPDVFPDTDVSRGDIADYFYEVQRFDRDVGEALDLLQERGELENTIVVMTGDHGWPFPRGKTQLYDLGARVPLAIRWPGKIKPGQTEADFVSLTDLAPTFLEAAGLQPPASMTGQSLVSSFSGAEHRDYVLTGRDRHTPSQMAPEKEGYPMRAIRTDDWLYIYNFRPDLWPMGQPYPDKANIAWQWFSDCDGGPIKNQMILEKWRSDEWEQLYQLTFGQRPQEELYYVPDDPYQMKNLADEPAHQGTKNTLRAKLFAGLARTGDPRVVGGEEIFTSFPYLGGGGGLLPQKYRGTLD
jgi:arylsulfatase A-like enzyme